VLYAKPADDVLPTPESCLLTGISPQDCLREGIIDVEFFKRIHAALSQPNTCSIGYNSIRFDDEFVRQGLYRNFFDPYEREWRYGNSRWDLLDVVRTCYALQLEGIEIPKDQEGRALFKLESLSLANGLLHEKAHDALSDVYATIGLAKKIKTLYPELFDLLYPLRKKRYAQSQLDLEGLKPFAHVSGMFPVEKGCLAAMVPIALNPNNPNAVICWNLTEDPAPLLDLTAEEIKARVFSPQTALIEPRLPIKQVHLNRSPIILPMQQLTPELAEHWQLKGDLLRQNLAVLRQYCQQPARHQALKEKLGNVFSSPDRNLFAESYNDSPDPERMLYSGPFFSDKDKALMKVVHQTAPEALAYTTFDFEDERLPEMLFRFRARNYPETLTEQEKQRWEAYRRHKLINDTASIGFTFQEFARRLEQLGQQATSDQEIHMIQELVAYGESIYPLADQNESAEHGVLV
jgi:exodeoxyribonuclease-1